MRAKKFTFQFDSAVGDKLSAGSLLGTIRPIPNNERIPEPGDRIACTVRSGGSGTRERRVVARGNINSVKRICIWDQLVTIDGTELKDTLADSFAVAHGYTDAADMASSVKQMYSMPFHGFCVSWKPCFTPVQLSLFE
ncbi:hypothetical protein [Herbaspirillum autotrophicum]|uniref:hypothetical protein n=1 Tax=Herbaspirillum autotrophicum TaxID=180195 RepID=UPI00067D5E42|nr:hypothetical protein [Herbaspirillum autotrophicum]